MKHRIALFSTVILVALLCVGPAMAKDEVTIVYSQWGSAEEIENAKTLIAEFEKQNPGVKVTMQVSGWGGYWQKLQTQIASGTAPDVMLMSGAYFLRFAAAGVFEPLGPFAQRDGVKLSDYFYQDDVSLYNGILYGLSRDMSIIGLFYNKTLFDKAKVSYPNENWTWNDYLEAAKALTKDTDGDGKIDQWGTFVANWVEECWSNFIWQNGGTMLSKDKKKCVIDSPEAIEAIQFVVDLIFKHKVAPLPTLMKTIGDPIVSGKVAMLYTGAYNLPMYGNIKDFEWDVAPLPKGKYRAAAAAPVSYVMSSRTKHPEQAWALIKFLTSKEAQEKVADMRAAIPALKSVAYSSRFLAAPPKGVKSLVDQLAVGHDLEFTPTWFEYQDAIAKELDFAFRGEKDVAECCKAAAKAANAVLSGR